jgi:hypothetical protein
MGALATATDAPAAATDAPAAGIHAAHEETGSDITTPATSLAHHRSTLRMTSTWRRCPKLLSVQRGAPCMTSTLTWRQLTTATSQIISEDPIQSYSVPVSLLRPKAWIRPPGTPRNLTTGGPCQLAGHGRTMVNSWMKMDGCFACWC